MANIQIGTNLRNCKITLAAEFYQPWGVLFSFQNNTTDVINSSSFTDTSMPGGMTVYDVNGSGIFSSVNVNGFTSYGTLDATTFDIPNDKDYIVSTLDDGFTTATYEPLTSNIQIPITKNGKTTLATKGTKNVEDIDINVDVQGGASLNIAYGNTAPSDTSKLWIKGSEPEEMTITTQQLFSTLSTKLPTAAYGIGTALVGTKIYLFGGTRSSGSSGTLNTIQVFDTTNNTISTLSTTLPTAAYYIGTAAVGTKIYLFGGSISAFPYSQNTIQVFDTTNNTISTLSTTLPIAAYGIGTAGVGTKIYLFGGRDSNDSLNTTIQVFDTTNNTISTLSTTLPTAAYDIGTAGVGTKIYLFGGRDSNGRLNTIQVFDTTNNTISTLSTTLPTAADDIGTAAVGTKIYLFGGYDSSSGRLNTIQVFDTTNNTISTLSTTLPTAANGIGTAAVGTKIYLFGGSGSSGRLNTINVFLTQIPLVVNNILITEGQQENVFNLLSSPTQVEISVKNVYRGNSSNVAQLNDAYLHNGTNWINVNTGETS